MIIKDYILPFAMDFTVGLPGNARVMGVQMAPPPLPNPSTTYQVTTTPNIVIFVAENPTDSMASNIRSREFKAVCSYTDFDDTGLSYIGTVMSPNNYGFNSYHLYEKMS